MVKTVSYEYPKTKPDYVGLRIENGKVNFIFPCNYVSDGNQISEVERKKDMLNLLRLIDKYKNIDIINDYSLNQSNFPFNSILWIIKNYLENGYYHIVEEEYYVGDKGKVNWSKTIKNNKLFLNTDSIVYSELIVKHNKNNVDNWLTKIHQYVVYNSICILGWYYNLDNNSIEKPYKIMPEEKMLIVLKQEYNKSFTDSKKELLKHMINVLEGLDESIYNTRCYDISTNNFEYVFERIVNERFSNALSSDFNPKCFWQIDKNKPNKAGTLRPDCVLFYNNNCYIIDAKYYQYGYNLNIQSLPEATSIQKQITYAKEIETNFQGKTDTVINNIYNIFILPCSSNTYLDYIGYAYSSWNNLEEKTYHKIHAFLVDLRSLINGSYENSKIHLINKLEEELKSNYIDNDLYDF